MIELWKSTDWFASCLMCFSHCFWCSNAGQYCQVNINECASRPCLNGGNCTDLVAGYSCTCPSAYVGNTCATPYCLANNPCRNGGTCHGAGLCYCPPAYSGSIRLTVSESYSLIYFFEIHWRQK